MARPMLWVMGITVPIVLACGGQWEEAVGEGVAERCAEMQGALDGVTDGEPRDRVESLLERCSEDARAGRIGVIEIASFEAEFTAAIDDDELTEDQVRDLEERYEAMIAD